MTKVKTCTKCGAQFAIARRKLCHPCFELQEQEKHQKKYRSDVLDKYSISQLDEMRSKAFDEHNVAVSSGGIYIVYKSINLATSQYYIGVHKHKDGDGYLGSGLRLRRSVKSYGAHSFIRYTLQAFLEPKEAFAAEKEIVSECLSDPLCLNLAEGGQGGALFAGRKHSEKTRALLWGKKFSEEERAIKKEEAKARKKEYYKRKRAERAEALVAGAGFEPA